MHSNLPVIPIFIPLLFAAVTVLFRKRIAMQRLLTTFATLLVLAFSILNIYMVNNGILYDYLMWYSCWFWCLPYAF